MKNCLRIFSIAIFAVTAVFFGCSKTDNINSPVALFDQGHDQQFLTGNEGPLDLSNLAMIFNKEGFKLKTSSEWLSPALLENTDALIISGPFSPVAKGEIKTITAFLNKGGKLCVMLHIASPAAELLKELGVAISNGPIREQTNLIDGSPLNFRITNIEQHPLTSGLNSFKVYGGWALINTRDNAKALAATSPRSWVDLNRDNQLSPGDAMQSLGVVVAGSYGKGEFVVFGDDAIFQNQFLLEENEALASNLVRWLKSGI